jgi:hypothetical protein
MGQIRDQSRNDCEITARRQPNLALNGVAIIAQLAVLNADAFGRAGGTRCENIATP